MESIEKSMQNDISQTFKAKTCWEIQHFWKIHQQGHPPITIIRPSSRTAAALPARRLGIEGIGTHCP